VLTAKSNSSTAAPARWAWLADLAAIDLRALAALRIGVALILLVDLAYRVRDLGAFYTDDGILTRAGRMNLAIQFCEPWWMSLHMLSGSFGWASFLAMVAGAAAIALLLGWRTKAALAVSWLLLYSIQARFPMLLQGGDVLLRCSLVWMFFLPISARWSLQRVREPEVLQGRTFVCLGGIGLLVQLGSMYFFSALLKTSPMWVGDFTATYYALQIDHFTKPLGYALTEYPLLLQVLTAAAILLEFVGPLLMLAPLGRRIWRWLIPLSFIGFHLGLYLCMDLGTFPWICMLCWMAFLPTGFWDIVESSLTKGVQSVVRPLTQASSSSEHALGVCKWSGSVPGNALAGFLMLYVLAMNTTKLWHPYRQVGAFPICHIGRLTGLEQYWNMFAPGPYPYGSWIRVEGVLPSGKLVNLYDPDSPLASEKPNNVSATYPTQYWRRCFVMGYEVREKPHLEGLLRYLSQRWNRTHSSADQVVLARFVFMATPTPPPMSPPSSTDTGERKPTIGAATDRQVLCEISLPSANVATK
jgi:hypothetical protein